MDATLKHGNEVKHHRAGMCACGSPAHYAGGNRVCLKSGRILRKPETDYKALEKNPFQIRGTTVVQRIR